VTQLSKSARRSRRAIGNSCVIPAKAGIQWRFRVIPAKAGIQRRFRVIPAHAGIQSLATNDAGFPLSRERRHSVP
jgi:hypothetical protein